MFVDTHCHLNFPQFNNDRAMVIGNAKKAGVKKFINPGVDPLSSKQAIALAQEHRGIVFAAVGIHPYEAQHTRDIRTLESLIQQCNNETMKQCIVAIGECGLDYHQYKGEFATGKKDKQKRLFEEQLRLALAYNLPVILHCRDGTSNVPAAFDGGAYEDFFRVLDSLPRAPRGVIHCFSGGLQELRFAQERKLFIGIDGNVTYSTQLARIIPHVPLSHLLLETDAPYLAPVPHRGTRNEPKYVPLIAKEVAKFLGVPVKEVEEATTANARELFSSLI